MNASESVFGELPNGKKVMLFSFDTGNGMMVKITNYWGIITSISTADRKGNMDEITAGFSTLDQYLKGHPHFGVIVGRFANRIAKGSFTIDGVSYNLPINNGPNHLHGGNHGFHTKLWDYDLTVSKSKAVLKLSYHSKHLEEGYPGNLNVTIAYTILPKNELQIEFSATTDAKTHINLTSHCYFNLNGFKSSIEDHELFVNASHYLPVDQTQIPTGELRSVTETPFNFLKPKLLGNQIRTIDGGIDHCFALENAELKKSPDAILICNSTGRKLEVFTSQPGIQVYTGNSLDGSHTGHNGSIYSKHMAICLETQHFPDTPNHPQFPSTLLKPNETYHQTTRMAFSVL
jgi:aldose 1-epimerase